MIPEKWSLIVDIKGTGATREILVSRLGKINKKSIIPVFDNVDKGFKTLTGSNLFLGLITIGPGDELYKQMPIKLERATIQSSSYIKDSKAEVYINHMSHYKYDVRKSLSGKLKLKWKMVDYEYY